MKRIDYINDRLKAHLEAISDKYEVVVSVVPMGQQSTVNLNLHAIQK